MTRPAGTPQPDPWFDATGPASGDPAPVDEPEPDPVRPFARNQAFARRPVDEGLGQPDPLAARAGRVQGSGSPDRRPNQFPPPAADHSAVVGHPAVVGHRAAAELHDVLAAPAVDPTVSSPAAQPAAPIDETRWYDEEAGPLVRLYALTRGRARARHEVFDLIAMISARPDRAHYRNDPSLSPEHAAVLELTVRCPRSVADLAADCDLPIGVTRVILSDLLEVGLIQVSRPAPDRFPDERMLREVINGLRAL